MNEQPPFPDTREGWATFELLDKWRPEVGAYFAQVLETNGWSINQLAAEWGLDDEWVRQSIVISEAIPEVRAAFHEPVRERIAWALLRSIAMGGRDDEEAQLATLIWLRNEIAAGRKPNQREVTLYARALNKSEIVPGGRRRR